MMKDDIAVKTGAWKGIQLEFHNLLVVENLGMQYQTEKSKRKKRYVTVRCNLCGLECTGQYQLFRSRDKVCKCESRKRTCGVNQKDFRVNDIIHNLKIIEDLGPRRPTETSKYKIRFVRVECVKCGLHIEGRYPKFREGLKVCPCSNRKGEIKFTCKHRLRIMRIWHGMKYRCYNPESDCFDRYGGIGVGICDQWIDDFESFYNWSLTHGYDPLLSIDRIDSAKSYSPDNCRWADAKTQNRNRKNTLDIKDVKEIKRMLLDGDSCRTIADKFNTPIKRIFYIRSGHTWADI